jgi:hypothetical protein
MSKKNKKNLPRHTRAIQRQRSLQVLGAPPSEVIEERLGALIQPAIYAQLDTFRAMGLRARVLTLPVMTTFVLSLIWRQVGAVSEAVRALNREGLLWTKALTVSQPAVSQRLNSLPAVLFENILLTVLPRMDERWHQRTRPLPEAVAWVQTRFSQVLVVDGSTLDSLLRKVGLLRDGKQGILAGHIAAVLNVVTRLPARIWYDADAQGSDQAFWERILSFLATNCLLLMDSGFLNYTIFDQLTASGRFFITRPKSNTAFQVQTVLRQTLTIHDCLIRLGSGKSACTHTLRLVELLWHGKWYRYLTNVTDAERLPPAVILALYVQRWRIEDAFNTVKRLLGLAYFWTGALNGILIQLWATWLLFAVLVDLTDELAQAMDLPFQAISLDMVFRGLYHFTYAYQRGLADDPVRYLVENAPLLGIVKRKRKIRSPVELLRLTIPSFP